MELDVQDGAYLLPDERSDEAGAEFSAFGNLPRLSFKARGAPPRDRELAVRGIRQFLLCYRRILGRLREPSVAHFQLVIPPEWVRMFVDAVCIPFLWHSNEAHTDLYLDSQLARVQPLLCKIVIILKMDCTFESMQKDTAYLAKVFAANWSPRAKDILKGSFVTMVGMRILDATFSEGLAAGTAHSHPGGHGSAHGHGHGHICSPSLGHITYAASFELGHRLEFPDLGATLPWIQRGYSTSVVQIAHAKNAPVGRPILSMRCRVRERLIATTIYSLPSPHSISPEASGLWDPLKHILLQFAIRSYDSYFVQRCIPYVTRYIPLSRICR